MVIMQQYLSCLALPSLNNFAVRHFPAYVFQSIHQQKQKTAQILPSNLYSGVCLRLLKGSSFTLPPHVQKEKFTCRSDTCRSARPWKLESGFWIVRLPGTPCRFLQWNFKVFTHTKRQCFNRWADLEHRGGIRIVFKFVRTVLFCATSPFIGCEFRRRKAIYDKTFRRLLARIGVTIKGSKPTVNAIL